MSSTCSADVDGRLPFCFSDAYPTLSEFLTPFPHVLHCHYTGTTDWLKLTLDFHELDVFHPEDTNYRSHFFVHSPSMVAIVHLTLCKRALSAQVKIWPPGSGKNVRRYNGVAARYVHHMHRNKIGNLNYRVSLVTTTCTQISENYQRPSKYKLHQFVTAHEINA
jgi:hypothetical protein